jgi:hypothetical protein
LELAEAQALGYVRVLRRRLRDDHSAAAVCADVDCKPEALKDDYVTIEVASPPAAVQHGRANPLTYMD